MSDKENTYHYLDYPYVSKSGYLTFGLCKYKFKRIYMEKNVVHAPKIAMEGTSLHALFFKLFDIIDYRVLIDMSYGSPKDCDAIANYFYSIMITEIPANFKNRKIFNNIKAFCYMESDHWCDLRQHYDSIDKIKYYFHPSLNDRETFFYVQDHLIFGSMDRIMYEKDITIICDFKTGNVPSKLFKPESYNGVYIRSSVISQLKSEEGNFYGMIYMICRLYHKFIKQPDGDYKCFDSHDKEVKKINLDYAFIYTNEIVNGKPAYMVARRHASVTTMCTILRKLDELRACKNYTREPNHYKCCPGEVPCPFLMTECREFYSDKFGTIFTPTIIRNPTNNQ